MPKIILTLIGLLCPLPAMAAEPDYYELNRLLAYRDYQSIAEIIDAKNDADDEIMNWLRRRSQEWHPPLFYTLSNKLAEKIIKNATANRNGHNKTLDAADSKLLREMAEFYARGKTSFMFDIGSCVDNRSAMPTYWLKRNDKLTLTVESLLALDRTGKGLATAAGLSFLWAKPIVENRINNPSSLPSATWLCGTENVLSDRDRHLALESKLNTVSRQIDERIRNISPN